MRRQILKEKSLKQFLTKNFDGKSNVGGAMTREHWSRKNDVFPDPLFPIFLKNVPCRIVLWPEQRLAQRINIASWFFVANRPGFETAHVRIFSYAINNLHNIWPRIVEICGYSSAIYCTRTRCCLTNPLDEREHSPFKLVLLNKQSEYSTMQLYITLMQPQDHFNYRPPHRRASLASILRLR